MAARRRPLCVRRRGDRCACACACCPRGGHNNERRWLLAAGRRPGHCQRCREKSPAAAAAARAASLPDIRRAGLALPPAGGCSVASRRPDRVTGGAVGGSIDVATGAGHRCSGASLSGGRGADPAGIAVRPAGTITVSSGTVTADAPRWRDSTLGARDLAQLAAGRRAHTAAVGDVTSGAGWRPGTVRFGGGRMHTW